MISAGEEKRAIKRAAASSTGIGAGFERALESTGHDDRRFLLWVSDGEALGSLEAAITRSEAVSSGQLPVLALERAVERYAGNFAAENRLGELLTASPIYLRSGDFRDSDFEGEGSA